MTDTFAGRQTVVGEMPKANIVGVAHRVELEAFHSRKIVLERRKRGAKLVSDVDLIFAQGQAAAARPLPPPSRDVAEKGGVTNSPSFPRRRRWSHPQSRLCMRRLD
jgi:hypothetical protein